MTPEDLKFLYTLEPLIETLYTSILDSRDSADYRAIEDLSNLVESMIKELEGKGI